MDLLNAWKKIKDNLTKSELELKLKDAIQDETKTNYLTLIEEITLKTENREDLEVIMKFINKKMNSKSWKKILKTLKLIIFLIKGSSKDFVNNLKYSKDKIKGLSNYFYEVNGAADIREKSDQILEFLNDENKLKTEREAYQNLKRISLGNEKRNTGGLLNSIGSYNVDYSMSDYGLSKNISKEIKEKEVENDSDSEGENENENSNNLFKMEEIFENKQQENPSNKIDLLSMNDLFTSIDLNNSSNINSNNFIFDFTKN